MFKNRAIKLTFVKDDPQPVAEPTITLAPEKIAVLVTGCTASLMMLHTALKIVEDMFTD